MLYLSFPVGWRFVGAEAGEPDSKDRLVDGGGRIIEIQDIVKECLRRKKRHAASIDIENKRTFDCPLTIYFRKLPLMFVLKEGTLLLQYEPTQNGKRPSTNAELLSGAVRRSSVEESALGPRSLMISPLTPRDRAGSAVSGVGSPCGSPRFFTIEVLSTARREKLERKACEQRENRRHTGDSPAPT